MQGKHCGQSMYAITDNKWYFRKKCKVCGKIIKQRKRQKGGETHGAWRLRMQVQMWGCQEACQSQGRVERSLEGQIADGALWVRG